MFEGSTNVILTRGPSSKKKSPFSPPGFNSNTYSLWEVWKTNKIVKEIIIIDISVYFLPGFLLCT